MTSVWLSKLLEISNLTTSPLSINLVWGSIGSHYRVFEIWWPLYIGFMRTVIMVRFSLYLSEAFDYVRHEILLQKTSYYNFHRYGFLPTKYYLCVCTNCENYQWVPSKKAHYITYSWCITLSCILNWSPTATKYLDLPFCRRTTIGVWGRSLHDNR